MAKLQIIWKKNLTVKKAFILHMLDLCSTYPGRWIKLPHYWGNLSHFTNNFRRIFKMKLLRFRGWAMYGDKDKCSYFINHLGPDAQHRKFNSQSAKSDKLLNLPHSSLWVIYTARQKKPNTFQSATHQSKTSTRTTPGHRLY